jgi:HEAT repeat protein
MSDRPSDAALWASVAETLRDTVLPNLTDPYAREAAIQLIGLAVYAGRRGNDPTRRRLEELAAVLGPAAGQDVLRSCVAVLADPYHRAHGPIREILERHLEDDVESETALLEALDGRVPRG